MIKARTSSERWILPFLFVALVLAACSIGSRNAPSSIYIVDVERGVIVNSVSGGEESYWGPSISPDGSMVAFSAFVEGSDVAEIHLMNFDGSDLRPLTNNGRSNYLPSWSPDGEVITYVSQDAAGTDTAEIYAILVDGTNEVPLTSNSAFEYGSTWDPDGEFIVFGTERGGNWQIFKMNSDGSNQRPLEIPAHGNAPSLSPDGSRIVFTSDREGNDDIWVMNVDGSDQMNLTPNDAWDDQPRWSADGAMIAFTSDRGGAPSIYLMNADGSAVREIFDQRFSDMAFASWHPDGQWLVFHGVDDG